MNETQLPILQNAPIWLWLGLGIGAIAAIPILYFTYRRLRKFLQEPIPKALWRNFQQTLLRNSGLVGLGILLLIVEFSILPVYGLLWSNAIELITSFAITVIICWLGVHFFRSFFDGYLLEASLKGDRKVNSELLIVAKILVNLTIVLAGILIYAQTHYINIIGLIASLGIGGLAVAFAAQKTLEQVLGGIVIYLDQPFVVDDYIGLPDGNFGKVESIGLRSTKIRTSGKGTLVVVPNNLITQSSIENFTGAKKVMAIVYLNFYQVIPVEDRALVKQVILRSTNGIFGIDNQNTNIDFRDQAENGQQSHTKVQITFFILGSGEVSMELRRQVLDLANQNITRELKTYDLGFSIEEPTIYVDSPITI